jgi:hypothetical protein
MQMNCFFKETISDMAANIVDRISDLTPDTPEVFDLDMPEVFDTDFETLPLAAGGLAAGASLFALAQAEKEKRMSSIAAQVDTLVNIFFCFLFCLDFVSLLHFTLGVVHKLRNPYISHALLIRNRYGIKYFSKTLRYFPNVLHKIIFLFYCNLST